MFTRGLVFNQTYPKGFVSLFITQALFNFSFFGLKSIFVLYLIHQYSLSQTQAVSLFATFMSLAYATSIIGGFVADKILGSAMTLVLGGSLSALSVLGFILFPSQNMLYLCLALLSIGSGFSKPNFSACLSHLFEENHDPRKDGAFASLYVAMNIGNLTGPLVCGFISQYAGYKWSFVPVMVSFTLGVCLFKSYQPLNSKAIVVKVKTLQLLSLLLITGLFYILFKHHDLFHGLMGIIVIVSIVCFSVIFYRCQSSEKTGLFKLIPYFILFTIFCALFEQAGGSLLLFCEDYVDRTLLNWTVPTATLLSINPVIVLLFGAMLPLLPKRLLDKGRAIPGLTKFTLGFFFIALSFALLGLSLYKGQRPISLNWIIACFLLQTVGELLIVPIGFATVSKLAPQRYLSIMMSLWIMCIAYGHYLAGFISKFGLNIINESQQYKIFFSKLSFITLLITLILFKLTLF